MVLRGRGFEQGGAPQCAAKAPVGLWLARGKIPSSALQKIRYFSAKPLDIYSYPCYNNKRRQGKPLAASQYADVAELADALDSGSSSLKRVWVQIPSSAPKKSSKLRLGAFSLVLRGRGFEQGGAPQCAAKAPVELWLARGKNPSSAPRKIQPRLTAFSLVLRGRGFEQGGAPQKIQPIFLPTQQGRGHLWYRSI